MEGRCMMKRFILMAVFIAIALCAMAERRALIIGNSNYAEGRLKNPVNDAHAVDATLQSLGFITTVRTDLDRRNFEQTVDKFVTSLRPEDEVLLYYSGHGVQINGENYLLPLGKNFKDPEDVIYEAINANKITEKLARVSISLIVLDACRDNPFQFYRSSSAKGMAVMNVRPSGQYVIYSTASGQVATDGSGNLSPFTQAFVTHAPTENITIEEMMRYIARDVRAASNNNQNPFAYGFFDSAYYLASAAATPEERRTEPIKPREIIPSTEIEVITGDLRITADFETKIWINSEPKGKLKPGQALNIRNVTIGSYIVESVTPTAKYGFPVQIRENQQSSIDLKSNNLNPQKLASLTINSEPSPCKLTIDGYQDLALQTPFRIYDPQARAYQFSFSLENYQAGSQRISSDPRLDSKHTHKLEPIFASIRIKSEPVTGKVYLDGRYIGDTPLSFDQNKTLKAGNHKLKVEPLSRDYATVEKDINLKTGIVSEETLQLSFTGAWLSIKADHYPIAVYLNGARNADLESGKKIMIFGWENDQLRQESFIDHSKTKQETTGYQRHLRVEYTGKELRFSKPYNSRLDLKPGEQLSLDVKLVPAMQKLNISSSRPGAVYQIVNQDDGNSHKLKGDGKMELPEGKYQIAATNFGYYSKTIPLTLVSSPTSMEQKIDFVPLPKKAMQGYYAWKGVKTASLISTLATCGFSAFCYIKANKSYDDYLNAKDPDDIYDKRQQFLSAQKMFNASIYVNIIPAASWLWSLNRTSVAKSRINAEASKGVRP